MSSFAGFIAVNTIYDISLIAKFKRILIFNFKKKKKLKSSLKEDTNLGHDNLDQLLWFLFYLKF